MKELDAENIDIVDYLTKKEHIEKRLKGSVAGSGIRFISYYEFLIREALTKDQLKEVFPSQYDMLTPFEDFTRTKNADLKQEISTDSNEFTAAEKVLKALLGIKKLPLQGLQLELKKDIFALIYTIAKVKRDNGWTQALAFLKWPTRVEDASLDFIPKYHNNSSKLGNSNTYHLLAYDDLKARIAIGIPKARFEAVEAYIYRIDQTASNISKKVAPFVIENQQSPARVNSLISVLDNKIQEQEQLLNQKDSIPNKPIEICYLYLNILGMRHRDLGQEKVWLEANKDLPQINRNSLSQYYNGNALLDLSESKSIQRFINACFGEEITNLRPYTLELISDDKYIIGFLQKLDIMYGILNLKDSYTATEELTWILFLCHEEKTKKKLRTNLKGSTHNDDESVYNSLKTLALSKNINPENFTKFEYLAEKFQLFQNLAFGNDILWRQIKSMNIKISRFTNLVAVNTKDTDSKLFNEEMESIKSLLTQREQSHQP